MINFTMEEINLMNICNSISRAELIHDITFMRKFLDDDETELHNMTNRIIKKLKSISDSEFVEICFDSVYSEEDIYG